MFSYILQTTICWTAFYLLYVLLLRKETFFHVNRWYLLSTLALGLLIPLIEWQPSPVIEHHPTYEIAIEPIQAQFWQLQDVVQEVSRPFELDWMDVVLAIYLSGVLFFTALLLHGLWKIWKLYRQSKTVQQGKFKVVYTEESHLPFSFFHFLFWSKTFEAEYQEQAQILRHEEAHIRQWHTLDVLFLEIINILFWCSPIIYFYRKSLRTTHEYLADALVLQDTNRKEYGHLLLKQSLSGLQIALANHFIHSQLKKRILMMTRNKSKKKALWKYLPMLPVLLLAILVFSKKESRAQVEMAVASLVATNNISAEANLKNLAHTFNAFGCCRANAESPHEEFSTDYMNFIDGYEGTKKTEIALLTKEIFSDFDITVSLQKDEDNTLSTLSFEKGTEGNNDYEMFQYHFDDHHKASNFEHTLGEFLKTHLDQLAIELVNTPTKAQISLEKYHAEISRWAELYPNRVGKIHKIANETWRSYHFNEKLLAQYTNYENSKSPNSFERKQCLDCAIQFIHPIQNPTKVTRTMGYGKRMNPIKKQRDFHHGIDYVVPENTSVVATAEGKIKSIRNYKGGYGKHIIIQHKDGYETLYAHLNEVKVKEGQPVKQGTVIALSGNTGVSTGPHLHYEIRKNGESIDPETIAATTQQHELFKVVEEMPRFPSEECEKMKDADARSKCAQSALVEYIRTNMKYPKMAMEANIEGMNVVKFVVEKDGSLSDIKLARDIGGETGEASLRVVQKMNEDSIRFTPGVQRGRTVRVQYTLPIKFKLSDDLGVTHPTEDAMQLNPSDSHEEIFKVVEEMPRFPSSECENIEEESARKKCANSALTQYLFQNLKYPKIAKDNQVEGMCVVQFVVEKDGSLSDIEIVRNVGSGCGEEAARVIEKMNKDHIRWKPGVQRGRKVRVRFTLPVMFKLSDDKTEKISEAKPSETTPSNDMLDLSFIQVYPNPTSVGINLQFTSTAKPVWIKVQDAQGKILYEEKIQDFDGNYNRQFELENAVFGMHFLTIEQDGKIHTENILIEK